ncbi:tRNA uracil 4-sulfurtransferase ThiI [Actinocorallia libanotica]|uniref:Probable tRNA sulfurtransferase n=1 Tax=Actinocorallia libanotica TaxID=46162 RepID=A0ABN1RA83_9ACTN
MPLAPAAGEPCVLLKLGEIVLKGKNRHQFEQRLQSNIRKALSSTGVGIDLWQRSGVIIIRAGSGLAEDVEKVARRLEDVMGIVIVHRAQRVPKDVESMTEAALEAVAQHPMSARGGSFAVRPRRRDKRFPITSSEIGISVGSAINVKFGLPVNLKTPDITVSIEVDRDEVFVYTDGAPGQGGLPVGSSGRGLVLMSGGIDSPVAAYRMMRRGLRVDYLHFSGMPFTGPESIYKAYALVRELDKFQGDSRLYVVPFGKAQQQIKSAGEDRLAIVAQRRLMLKTAEIVAERRRAGALITGDALGQVASQTLVNMTALDDAVDLPILRPLVGMDKIEIMDQARRNATLAISELPDEDCCSMLAPRRPETAARIADLRQIEKRLDAEELAEQLADSVQEHRPVYGSD